MGELNITNSMKLFNNVLYYLGLVKISELNNFDKTILSNYGLKRIIDIDEYRQYCRKSKKKFPFRD